MKKIFTCLLSIIGLTTVCAQVSKEMPVTTDTYEVDVFKTKSGKTVKPKVLFPYHYGQTDVKEITSQLKDSGIEVRIRHYE